MTIKLTIEAEDISELMDDLMTEIPQMYVDFHCNKHQGGQKLKWKVSSTLEKKSDELLKQVQDGENRGLLPKGYTAWMKKELTGEENGK